MSKKEDEHIIQISDYLAKDQQPSFPLSEGDDNLAQILSSIIEAESSGYLPSLTDEDILCLKKYGIIN